MLTESQLGRSAYLRKESTARVSNITPMNDHTTDPDMVCKCTKTNFASVEKHNPVFSFHSCVAAVIHIYTTSLHSSPYIKTPERHLHAAQAHPHRSKLNPRLPLKRLDQPTRTGVMSRTLPALLQLGLDLLGQALAELDAPLVEAVDVPHRAFGEG